MHDRIAGSWGYIEGSRARKPRAMIDWLVEVVSKNGVLALNVSPKGDGSIPQDQQDCLRAIGSWSTVRPFTGHVPALRCQGGWSYFRETSRR